MGIYIVLYKTLGFSLASHLILEDPIQWSSDFSQNKLESGNMFMSVREDKLQQGDAAVILNWEARGPPHPCHTHTHTHKHTHTHTVIGVEADRGEYVTFG